MFTIGWSSKLFTMQSTLLALKLNSLLSDAVLIKQPISKTYLKSLLSQIPSMQQKRSLTLPQTCFKSKQLSFLMTSESSSIVIMRTLLNPGSALVLYASSLIQKLYPCGRVTFKTYKPAFHSGHLSRNMSYNSTANLRVFYLPRRRYSYPTQSSMTELPLSVSQH